MDRKFARSVALAAPLLSIALGGCTTVGGFVARLIDHRPAQQLQIRTAASGASEVPATLPADRLYEAASRSIRARDYAGALDILQIARERVPGDARVLNALGVVYDKLGRFDLSERYYTLAARAEPGSTIVASNVRYSAMLLEAQRRPAPAPTATQLAVAELHPIAMASVSPTPPTIRRAIPIASVRRATPTLAGGRLTLVSAGGRALQPTRAYLAEAGWVLARADETSAPQDRSEIRFDTRIEPVALALARTLPFKVTLSACASACSFQLVLGRDAPQAFAPRGGRS